MTFPQNATARKYEVVWDVRGVAVLADRGMQPCVVLGAHKNDWKFGPQGCYHVRFEGDPNRYSVYEGDIKFAALAPAKRPAQEEKQSQQYSRGIAV